jgi:hypothetical protein
VGFTKEKQALRTGLDLITSLGSAGSVRTKLSSKRIPSQQGGGCGLSIFILMFSSGVGQNLHTSLEKGFHGESVLGILIKT